MTMRFLLSEIEIFGSTTYSYAGEGKQYQYFKNAIANRYKKPRYDDSRVSGHYWERSPYSGSENKFCHVNISGNSYYNGVSYYLGIAPCLCI